MHSREYAELITEQASALGINVRYFTGNWAIELEKDGQKKFIVGYTFPLNDAATYKMIRNKNLVSEILDNSNIPNVPHHLLLNPSVLQKRKQLEGNVGIISRFVNEFGFPLVLKKNNSTKGQGVYLIQSQTELENILPSIYATDLTMCLSPYRGTVREFRNVVLDGACLLSYEKIIPALTGDGIRTVAELVGGYVAQNRERVKKNGDLFDPALQSQFKRVPSPGEVVPLAWKHNKLAGSVYQELKDPEMEKLAVSAALALNARFVSVDIIESANYGMEVMEINASVGIHFAFENKLSVPYQLTAKIFRTALAKIFNDGQ